MNNGEKNNKILKTLLLSLIAALLLAVVCVACLPSLLSTEWGKQKVFKTIKALYKVEMTCDRLSLTWFGHQEITNLVCDTPQGSHFQCDIIKTEVQLFSLLFKRKIGHLYFDRPYLQYVASIHSPENRPNKKPHTRSVKEKKPRAFCSSMLPFSGAVICTYGKLCLQTKEVSPISFDDVQFEINNSGKLGLFAHMSLTTQQDEIKGTVHLDARCVPAEQTLNATVCISHFPVVALDEILCIFYPQYATIPTTALGTSVDLSLKAIQSKETFNLNLDASSPQLPEVTLECKSTAEGIESNLHATLTTSEGKGVISGSISKGIARFSIDTPQCKVQDVQLEKNQMLYTLQKPVSFTCKQVQGEMASLTADLSRGYKVNASLPVLSYRTTLQPIALTNSELSLDYQPTPQSAKVRFSTQAQGQDALSLIGEQLTCDFNLQQSKGNLILYSPLIDIKAHFAMQNDVLQLTSPAQMQWKLTPQGYAVLDRFFTGQNSPFGLKEATTLQLTFSTCRLPLRPLDLPSLECKGQITDPSLLFLDQSSTQQIALSNLNATWSKGKREDPLSFTGSVQTQDGANQTGLLTVQGKLAHLYEKMKSVQISLQCKNFPSRILDIGRSELPFSKVLGTSFEASLSTSIEQSSGPVSVTLQSPNLQLAFKGAFANGVLKLQEPLHAQAKITRDMSRLFLNEVNPLSLSDLYSEGLVTLDIPAKGFSLPCQPFSIETSVIPNARIDLGKIACRNEGNVNIALDLLKANQYSTSQELLLWFAPLDLHLSEGTLDIERTEILLANTFDIALWGQLYFPSHDVDMILGLTAQTLRKAFGIQNLPDNYVLTLPMTGKTDNVKINTKKATTKIALLLAAQQKALSKKGGAGALIGGMLQQMVTLPDNGKVPPAKRPFPWETSAPKKTN